LFVDKIVDNFVWISRVIAVFVCAGVFFSVGQQSRTADDPRTLEIDRVHDFDLPEMYAQLNTQYYDGQLPAHIVVAWSPLVADKDCDRCAGLTDWDTGFPRIRLDPAGVHSEKFLREAMEHEMCHVATADAIEKVHEDFHGPLFQACMQRYH
jgi:hypothetical protein